MYSSQRCALLLVFMSLCLCLPLCEHSVHTSNRPSQAKRYETKHNHHRCRHCRDGRNNLALNASEKEMKQQQ